MIYELRFICKSCGINFHKKMQSEKDLFKDEQSLRDILKNSIEPHICSDDFRSRGDIISVRKIEDEVQ